MSAHDVDGLNSGYARLLLEDYLEDPDAVPEEWRRSSRAARPISIAGHPGLQRLLELAGGNGGNGQAVPEAPAHASVAEPAPAAAAPAATFAPPPLAPASEAVDETLLGAVAAAMALVKAHRMHGHLAARLDPLGLRAARRSRARRVLASSRR